MEGQSVSLGASLVATVLPLLVFLGLYSYIAYCVQVMAQKTGTPDGWLAWVPIVNIFLMIRMAGKSYWWFLLLLVPLVNIVVSAILWMNVAVRRNKPGWVGLLMLIPLVNLIVPGYLAFSD